jgi:hypothetical protein
MESGILGGGLTFIEPVSQQLMGFQSQLSSEAQANSCIPLLGQICPAFQAMPVSYCAPSSRVAHSPFAQATPRSVSARLTKDRSCPV